MTPEEEKKLRDRIELLESTLQYVVLYGSQRPIQRVQQVCQMTLQGIDPRQVLRE